MQIYWKYWDSLHLWKDRIEKTRTLIFIVFSLIFTIDFTLIFYFDEKVWKIVFWSLLAAFFMRKEILAIIQWMKEMKNKEIAIMKGYSWEEKVATILNSMAMSNPKITVIHDIFIGHENIDHIFIYDNKFLLLIETKAKIRFPHFLFTINAQIRRQWNFIYKKTGIYVKPLCVFTEVFVEPHKKQKEIDYININYLESYIKLKIEREKYLPQRNMADEILKIKNAHIDREVSYFSLLAW